MSRYGIEIEFAANLGTGSWLRERVEELGFHVGTDRTAGLIGKKGYEVRHQTPVMWNENSINCLRQTLNYIKQRGVRVHKMCGLHFHFSGFGKINEPLFTKLATNNRTSNWKSRSSYCTNSLSTKYRVIRHISYDHYECRIFNGTLSLRAICKYQERMEKWIMGSCLDI